MKGNKRNIAHTGRQCADLAARLLVEGSARGFAHARRKAADRLNIVDTRQLPDNRALFCALIDYQRLFDRPTVTARTARLRQAALDAMQFFEQFSPFLTGAVMYGTPLEQSPICFHLFTDEVEAISRFLLTHRYAYRLAEISYRISSRLSERYSRYEISRELFDYELIVMPLRRLAQAPLDPLDGNPFERLSPAQLEVILATGPGELYACGPRSIDELIAGRE